MESIPSIVPIPVPFCNLGSKDEIKYSDAETKPSLSSGFGARSLSLAEEHTSHASR